MKINLYSEEMVKKAETMSKEELMEYNMSAIKSNGSVSENNMELIEPQEEENMENMDDDLNEFFADFK